jgi:hypothetical protein
MPISSGCLVSHIKRCKTLFIGSIIPINIAAPTLLTGEISLELPEATRDCCCSLDLSIQMLRGNGERSSRGKKNLVSGSLF